MRSSRNFCTRRGCLGLWHLSLTQMILSISTRLRAWRSAHGSKLLFVYIPDFEAANSTKNPENITLDMERYLI